MTKLINDRIPAHTVCPFRDKCIGDDSEYSQCGHSGLDHTVEYSCGFARAFDITERGDDNE